jgi:hypothetical protein
MSGGNKIAKKTKDAIDAMQSMMSLESAEKARMSLPAANANQRFGAVS